VIILPRFKRYDFTTLLKTRLLIPLIDRLGHRRAAAYITVQHEEVF
jgi:hypothetical protein